MVLSYHQGFFVAIASCGVIIVPACSWACVTI